MPLDLSKLDRLPSRQLAEYIRAHAHIVEDIDHGSGYCTPTGMAYDVLLARGWGYDHYGDHMHTIIEPRAADVIAFLKTAEQCMTIGCDDAKNW